MNKAVSSYNISRNPFGESGHAAVFLYCAAQVRPLRTGHGKTETAAGLLFCGCSHRPPPICALAAFPKAPVPLPAELRLHLWTEVTGYTRIPRKKKNSYMQAWQVLSLPQIYSMNGNIFA